MTDRLRAALLESPDVSRLRGIASEDGFVSMREDAWVKVQAGVTTVEEALRVVQI